MDWFSILLFDSNCKILLKCKSYFNVTLIWVNLSFWQTFNLSFVFKSFDLETYTNTEVIAIDQDKLGIQGRVVASTCDPFTEADLKTLVEYTMNLKMIQVYFNYVKPSDSNDIPPNTHTSLTHTFLLSH